MLKSTSKSVDISYAFNGNYRPILCQYISQVKKCYICYYLFCFVIFFYFENKDVGQK